MKVLLIDDDRDLIDLLRYSFQRNGYKVLIAYDGDMGIRTFELEAPDLIVLDLMMPKRDGMQVLREIRRASQVPIIILSASGDEDRLVTALENGADDFVVKPFRPRELRARSQALVRRSKHADEPKTKPVKVLTFGDLTLDPGTRQVTMQGRQLQLTPKEFGLLYYLMLNSDTVLNTADLISKVWGFDSNENEEVLKVAIYRLRHKVEPNPSQPRYILNVPGQGYMFQCKSPNVTPM